MLAVLGVELRGGRPPALLGGPLAVPEIGLELGQASYGLTTEHQARCAVVLGLDGHQLDQLVCALSSPRHLLIVATEADGGTADAPRTVEAVPERRLRYSERKRLVETGSLGDLGAVPSLALR